jgi:hypothetical protein
VPVEVIRHRRRDSGRQGHGPASRISFRLTDHPSTADTPDRPLDAEPSTGQDVGPAQGRGLTEPEPAEREYEDKCAVALGPLVAPELFSQLQRLHRGQRPRRPARPGVPAPRSLHGLDG